MTSHSDATLLPCPFCGWNILEIEGLGVRQVSCQNQDCEASGPIAKDGAEAVRLWNTRAEPSR